MKLVVFGLTISSSWGNGHATLWRGLCRALAARGHATTFLERNTANYAAHRDLPQPPGCDLRIYERWSDVRHAVVLEGDRLVQIQVKRADARSHWVWGAFKMTGAIPAELRTVRGYREAIGLLSLDGSGGPIPTPVPSVRAEI